MPYPSHAIAAKSVSVATTPIVLMSGRMPAVVNATMSERNALGDGHAYADVSTADRRMGAKAATHALAAIVSALLECMIST